MSLTALGQPIKNETQVVELLAAIFLPSILVINKVSGHLKSDTIEAKRKLLADHPASTAALQNKNSQLTSAFAFQHPSNPTDILLNFQGTGPGKNKKHLDMKGKEIKLHQRAVDRPKCEA